jgi:hypothetical protein
LTETPAFYATPEEWRAWLEANHADAREHWVGDSAAERAVGPLRRPA